MQIKLITGFEPVNLILTKDALYLLSYISIGNRRPQGSITIQRLL